MHRTQAHKYIAGHRHFTDPSMGPGKVTGLSAIDSPFDFLAFSYAVYRLPELLDVAAASQFEWLSDYLHKRLILTAVHIVTSTPTEGEGWNRPEFRSYRLYAKHQVRQFIKDHVEPTHSKVAGYLLEALPQEE